MAEDAGTLARSEAGPLPRGRGVEGAYFAGCLLSNAAIILGTRSVANRLSSRASALWPAEDLVDLASPDRRVNILDGWSDDQIMHYVSDIATDPRLRWNQQTGKLGAA